MAPTRSQITRRDDDRELQTVQTIVCLPPRKASAACVVRYGPAVRFSARLGSCRIALGEGPLTEPTADTRACQWELVKMPHTCLSRYPSGSAQLGGFATVRFRAALKQKRACADRRDQQGCLNRAPTAGLNFRTHFPEIPPVAKATERVVGLGSQSANVQDNRQRLGDIFGKGNSQRLQPQPPDQTLKHYTAP